MVLGVSVGYGYMSNMELYLYTHVRLYVGHNLSSMKLLSSDMNLLHYLDWVWVLDKCIYPTQVCSMYLKVLWRVMSQHPSLNVSDMGISSRMRTRSNIMNFTYLVMDLGNLNGKLLMRSQLKWKIGSGGFSIPPCIEKKSISHNIIMISWILGMGDIEKKNI